MTGRQGVSLLIVVALLGLLSVTAGMAALAARGSASAAFASLERLQLSAAIESAAARTALRLTTEEDQWQADGRLYEMEIGSVRLRIRPLAESARFDLNHGNTETLLALLEELGVSPLASRRISGAVADWRDPDGDVGENGAEGTAYRAAGRTGPANRPFLAVEEFRQILHVDTEIFSAVQPYLTLNGGEAVVGQLAPQPLMVATGLSPGDVRRVLAARRQDRPIPELTGTETANAGQAQAYAVFIEAESRSGARMAREIIINLPGEDGLYDTLSRHSHVYGYADFLDPEPDA